MKLSDSPAPTAPDAERDHTYSYSLLVDVVLALAIVSLICGGIAWLSAQLPRGW